jgi:hypothetical protein
MTTAEGWGVLDAGDVTDQLLQQSDARWEGCLLLNAATAPLLQDRCSAVFFYTLIA